MIPHHVYYQLAVIGFLWLCIMLHYTWPSRSAVSPQLPTEPVPTKFKRVFPAHFGERRIISEGYWNSSTIM
jgi:hypothetical protein